MIEKISMVARDGVAKDRFLALEHLAINRGDAFWRP